MRLSERLKRDPLNKIWHEARYNGMLTVRWAQGTNTKRAGRLPDRVLARMMLRELATEEKHRAP